MEIKPCPFCGSKNVHVTSYSVMEFKGRNEQNADVECSDCDGSISYTSKDPLCDSAEQGAINKWNRRINENIHR